MGYVLSKLGLQSPAGYDDPDPVTGLTPRERDVVQNSWKLVRANPRENAVKLFMRFFELYPETQKLFKPFADVPLAELPRHGKLIAHATSVLYALNCVIDNLADPECLVPVLVKVGTSHKPRDIKDTHFRMLATFLVSFLKESLPASVMNEFAQASWKKTLDVAFDIIIKALQEA